MTTKNPDINFDQLLEWIGRCEPILLVTHGRPDGDAIGSLIGLYYCLQTLGIENIPFVADPVPKRYVDYMPPTLIVGGSLDIDRYEGILCLDCATAARLALPKNLDIEKLTIPVCNLDHHVDNSRYGDLIFVGEKYSATAEILAHFVMAKNLTITSDAATMLAMGMITDTGGFRFDNTTSETLRIAGWLVEKGAQYRELMNRLFCNESIQILKLRAQIIDSVKFAFDNRLAYFFLTPDQLTEFGVDNKDTEDLIDCVRVIRDAEIVCRLQQVEDGIRYSLRSTNPKLRVNRIAHQLGGGGHEMAAGAHVKDIDLETGEKLLLDYAQIIFNEKQ